MKHPALCPGLIGGLELKNRFIKTATYEGMSPSGRVSDALIQHHVEMAQGGVALTTVAYAAVCPDGRTFEDQLLLDDDNRNGLKKLANAVHEAGAKVSIQLGHCGGFSKNKRITGGKPMGPSAAWNAYGLMSGVPRIRAMTVDDILETQEAYVRAALLVKECGFDAMEVHCGHGYLLSQFLSPVVNYRHDEWGKDLVGRLRFPMDVIRAIRTAVGRDFAILAKMNTSDGVRNGSSVEDAVEIGQALIQAGADLLIPSGGLVFKTPFFLMRGDVPLRLMVKAEKNFAQRWALRIFGPRIMRPYKYKSNFFFEDSVQILKKGRVPVALVGGVDSAKAAEQAMDAGFDFVVMGRALLADPNFVNRLRAGEAVVSRCNHCNACVGEMDLGGVRCVLEPSASA